MLRGLLRDSEAAKALFEKFGLFKDPERLEKYVIASEVTVEVLDLFLSRLFGTEGLPVANDSGDLRALCESLCGSSLSAEKGDADENRRSARSNEANEEADGLRLMVQNLERQLCAIQRQVQMQGNVSQILASLDGRIDESARECERRISAVSDHVGHLERELSDRARTAEVKVLSEEVLHLKDSERSLGNRISGVEKAMEAERAPNYEIPCGSEKRSAMTKMIQIDPLNGIIEKLTRDCGGNVHEKGVVEVTASSCSLGSAKDVVDLGADTCLYSYWEPDQWIRYDFKQRSVTPTGYSIRSGSEWCPKSWVFEVSNDGKNWQVVDRRDNNEDLKAGDVWCNFAIIDHPHGNFRFVRLRQTGTNHYGDNQLVIAALEVFGTLSAP